MVVPIDLLKPILDDLLSSAAPTARRARGSASTPPRSAARSRFSGSPAAVRRSARSCGAGDIVLSVAGSTVSDLAGLFRRVWALGEAGVEVPLLINREGKTFELRVRSGDRRRFLKGPVLH